MRRARVRSAADGERVRARESAGMVLCKIGRKVEILRFAIDQSQPEKCFHFSLGKLDNQLFRRKIGSSQSC